MRTRLCLFGLLLVLLASPCLAFHGERSLFFEDFEAVSPPAPPAGWVVVNPAGDTGMWETRPYGGVAWGVRCIRYRCDATQPADDWVFTAPLTLSAGVQYDLSYLARGGLTAPPTSLEVFVGTAPDPTAMTTVLLPVHPVDWSSYVEENASFVPPVGGTYYVGWHAVGPAAAARLFIDDVDLTTPETDLRLSMGVAKELDLLPLVFGPSDTVDVCVYLENAGTTSQLVNTRFTVGRYPSNTELDFYITGPTGRLPIINMFQKLGDLTDAHFSTLGPGQMAGRPVNLWSWYEFATPGDYTIEVHYRNYSDPGGLGAWKGELVSDPVIITIE